MSLNESGKDVYEGCPELWQTEYTQEMEQGLINKGFRRREYYRNSQEELANFRRHLEEEKKAGKEVVVSERDSYVSIWTKG